MPSKSNTLRPLAALPWKRLNIGSRMNREVHVRIWERPEVRVLRATRLHPLIWGIGVKRKFSASRTAFLRKLRRRWRDKRVIRDCSKQRQVRRAASVLSLRQRPHQLISGSVIGTVTIIPHSAGEEAGRWDQSGKAAMSQVGARSHTDPGRRRSEAPAFWAIPL